MGDIIVVCKGIVLGKSVRFSGVEAGPGQDLSAPRTAGQLEWTVVVKVLSYKLN